MKSRKLLLSLLAAACLAVPSKMSAQSWCINSYEPNNNLNGPAYFPLNTTLQSGITSSTDVDYYRVDVPGTQTLNLSLTNLGANYSLALLSTTGTLLRSSNHTGTSPENITYLNASGTYVVRVTGVSGAFSTSLCYTLKNSVGCTDAYESNNTLASYAPITVNQTISAAIYPAYDIDYYRFYVSGTGYLSLSLYNLPANYNLELRNSSGGLLKTSSQLGTTSELITYNIVASGYYYARVIGVSGANSTACYSLRPSFSPRLCVDSFEPNQTLGTAKVISPNTSYAAKITSSTDQDWFRVTTTSSLPNLRVTLTGLPVNYNLYLYNSAGTLLRSSTNAGTTSETVIYNSTIARTYYIRVLPVGGVYSQNCYIVRAYTRGTVWAAAAEDSSMARMSEEELDSNNDLETLDAMDNMNTMTVSPNPAKAGEELFVNFNGMENAKVRILDINGKVVSKQSITSDNQAKISLVGIEPGLYILDNGNGQMSRFVVE